MKKSVRLVLVLTALVLLAAAWVWRYVTLNKYYDDLDNGDYQLYQSGELVPFEDDGNDLYTDLSGYYIRVDGYEVKDYAEYLADAGIDLSAKASKPDKLALVHITLFNETCEPNPVKLNSMMLHGVDSVITMDWDVLVKGNPILNGYTGIALERGMECQLVLPFALFQDRFENSTWRKIDTYEMYLQVTSSLTTKDIAVN